MDDFEDSGYGKIKADENQLYTGHVGVRGNERADSLERLLWKRVDQWTGLTSCMLSRKPVGKTIHQRTESVSMTRLYEHHGGEGGGGRGGEKSAFQEVKMDSEPTQNWCCQSFYAEGYTKEEI
jgi:hypothetical protein